MGKIYKMTTVDSGHMVCLQVVFPLTYALCILMNGLSASKMPVKLSEISKQNKIAI